SRARVRAQNVWNDLNYLNRWNSDDLFIGDSPMAGPDYDVIVVGAGNAGLSAALAAQQMGTKVLLLDKCPKASRGGNTRFSGGGFRFTYNGIDDMRPMLPGLADEEAAKLEVGSDTASDFLEAVMQVTEYAPD